MRRSRLLARSACLTATMALCACASSSSASSSGTTTPASCQYRTDRVLAQEPVVEVMPFGSATPRPIGTQKSLPLACGTTVTVRSASGQVETSFGTQGLCLLTTYRNPPASLISRTPSQDLLTFQSGDIGCTVTGPVSLPPDVVKCPFGEVETRDGQFWSRCAADAVFEVAVHTGSVKIIGPNGATREVAAGAEFAFDFSSGAFQPTTFAIPAVDLSAFAFQAAELRLK